MNKEKLNTIIKYLIAKGVTAEDFLDIFFENNEPAVPKKEPTTKKPGRPKKANTKSATTIYTASEVCSKLNVKPADLKQMIAEGDFPAPDSQGKWSQSSMSRFL